MQIDSWKRMVISKIDPLISILLISECQSNAMKKKKHSKTLWEQLHRYREKRERQRELNL